MDGLGRALIKSISYISEEFWFLFLTGSVPTQNNQAGNGAEGHRDIVEKKPAELCSQGLFQDFSVDFYLSALLLKV